MRHYFINGSVDINTTNRVLVESMRKDPYGLTQLLAPSIHAMGFELWGIEYHGNTKNAILRVFIDHENGIVIEDCERVSHQISGLLDVNDPIPGHYTLEVSSPGLDRPFFTLEQMQAYLQQHIKLQLNTMIEGRKRCEGHLIKIENGHLHLALLATSKHKKKQVINSEISLEASPPCLVIPFDAIDRANLVVAV